METAKMVSQGQRAIPKRIQDVVQAKVGTRFSVRLEGRRILLEIPRNKKRKITDWQGLNPARVKMTATNGGGRTVLHA